MKTKIFVALLAIAAIFLWPYLLALNEQTASGPWHFTAFDNGLIVLVILLPYILLLSLFVLVLVGYLLFKNSRKRT